MALKVIGAGWGRTGTESLKKALEILGFDKCYHMFELLKDGKRLQYWEQLSRGEKPDYDKLFDGYQSSVDFFACMYYKEFMEQYPQAKVVLSYRDAEKWYESASKTILKPPPQGLFLISRFMGLFNKNIGYFPKIYAHATETIFDGLMQGRRDDKDFMINLYNQWVDEVRKTVPPEKLLVHQAVEGWEPLCKFLNVPIPSVPYPRGNDTEQFQARLKPMSFMKEFSEKAEG